MILRPHWIDWSDQLLQLHWRKAMLDPWHFLTTFCYTVDEHDPMNPIKLIPDKPYIKLLVRSWQKVPLLAVVKSRQMMVSWIFVCLYLWDAMFHGYGRKEFFQSRKEEEANDLIIRAHQVWKFLPGKPYKTRAKLTYCKLTFPDIGAQIRGVPQPQGPDDDPIRGPTASGILSDEMASQKQAEQAYIAAKPTIVGGGRFTAISTPRGVNFFKRLVFDEQ